ncbi:MAG: hypothetical protein OCU12_07990 [Methanophagales archaeon]|nr:hypothetical protein [Methanophagales archaeon]
MTLKEQILDILDEGETDYGSIAERTGATRSYIRSVAYHHRKGKEETEMVEKTEVPAETPEEDQVETEVKEPETLTIKAEPEHERQGKYKPFDEWLKERKYECECGCVLGRTAKYCPHCGVELDWSGVE